MQKDGLEPCRLLRSRTFACPAAGRSLRKVETYKAPNLKRLIPKMRVSRPGSALLNGIKNANASGIGSIKYFHKKTGSRSKKAPLNNFDLLRLILATLVVFEHAYLVGLEPLQTDLLGIPIDAQMAVQGFFVVSGYLIFQSWERASDWRDYMFKRIRRIYPAYFSVVVAMAVVGVFLTSRDIIGYFASTEWVRYLAANLVFLNFLQPTLPGVFADNAVSMVNGPLWTIKIEVMFYLSVPVLALLGRRFRTAWVLAAFYVVSFLWADFFSQLYASEGRTIYLKLAKQLPGQLSFFVGGGILFYYFDFFKRYAHWFALGAVTILLARFNSEIMVLRWLYPAALAIIVIYFAEILRYLGNFGRYGDLSYGLYILHYPVLQILAAATLFASPGLTYVAGCALSVALAYLSWHVVEKPALLRSSHYRRAETPDDGSADVCSVTRRGRELSDS